MPALSYTSADFPFQPFTKIYAADVNQCFTDISTLLNTTKLDATNIQPLAITTALINNLAVTTGKIAANAVTAVQIANATITNTQLASGAALANIGAGGITSTYLAANSVTSPAVAAGFLAAAPPSSSISTTIPSSTTVTAGSGIMIVGIVVTAPSTVTTVSFGGRSRDIAGNGSTGSVDFFTVPPGQGVTFIPSSGSSTTLVYASLSTH